MKQMRRWAAVLTASLLVTVSAAAPASTEEFFEEDPQPAWEETGDAAYAEAFDEAGDLYEQYDPEEDLFSEDGLFQEEEGDVLWPEEWDETLEAAGEFADSLAEVGLDELFGTISGECGVLPETVYWEIDTDGILTIYGEGAMQNWEDPADVPWYEYADQITELNVLEGVTLVGSNAFGSLSALSSARIG